MVAMPTDANTIYAWGASLPRASDLRYSWALARLDRLDADEARELVLDAWDMVVPRFLARQVRLTLGMVRHGD